MKLLVVDDDQTMRMVWQEIVACWDLPIELSVAKDGNHALLQVICERPDLIITDLEMPNADGRELIKLLRDHPPYANIPIVVASGSPANDLIVQPSVIAYLAKPFHFEEIYQLLKEQIRKLAESVTLT